MDIIKSIKQDLARQRAKLMEGVGVDGYDFKTTKNRLGWVEYSFNLFDPESENDTGKGSVSFTREHSGDPDEGQQQHPLRQWEIEFEIQDSRLGKDPAKAMSDPYYITTIASIIHVFMKHEPNAEVVYYDNTSNASMKKINSSLSKAGINVSGIRQKKYHGSYFFTIN